MDGVSSQSLIGHERPIPSSRNLATSTRQHASVFPSIHPLCLSCVLRIGRSTVPSACDATHVLASTTWDAPSSSVASFRHARRVEGKQTEFLLHKEEHKWWSRTYDAMVLRSHARGLFRDALRAARRWEGGAEEAEYIRKEARRLCRTELPSGNPREVEARIDEGKQRLELAMHYNIAYPRLYHKPNSGGMVLERTVDAPKLPGAEDGDEQDDDWEMADATRESLRKARERLARRNEEVRAA